MDQSGSRRGLRTHRPKSLERWRRITAIVGGILAPEAIPLEDYRDACDFLEATGRTVPAGQWAEDVIAASVAAANETMF